MTEFHRLTQFSRASGCGCKIAPADLENILKEIKAESAIFPGLLRGAASADDAAVWDLGDGTVLVATTDFFMPAVDHPGHFGQIAAANALSDVYAMGARPMFALALLGWPLEKLGTSSAAEVLNGARQVCGQASVPIAGGHSVETLEPLFGLAVVGRCPLSHLKTNGGARPGDLIYLTKPLGTGILLSAFKRNLLDLTDVYPKLLQQLTRLNSVGERLGSLTYVHALTDVTGFGLLGHLAEVCRASEVSAVLSWHAVPVIPEAASLAARFIYPDITFRNWNHVKDEVTMASEASAEKILLLCDPQTNGGLLIFVDPQHRQDFESMLKEASTDFWLIGKIAEREAFLVMFDDS
jgi:selenide,water dikinase